MKKIFLIVPLLLLSVVALQAHATTPLTGKIIALDAGHGGGEVGATGYCGDIPVLEVDVNIAVRAELAQKITDAEGIPYDVKPLSSRSDRVADAESAGSEV